MTLQADQLPIYKWWIDAAYEVHNDMRSHTGGVLSIGKGAIGIYSRNQKINTKSSTEAEVVGVDDISPHIFGLIVFGMTKDII